MASLSRTISHELDAIPRRRRRVRPCCQRVRLRRFKDQVVWDADDSGADPDDRSLLSGREDG